MKRGPRESGGRFFVPDPVNGLPLKTETAQPEG